MESIIETDSESENMHIMNYDAIPQPIPVIISQRLPKPVSTARTQTIRTIKYNSKKVVTASQLPVVVNLNPRSIYNKKNEFKTMMEQLEVDCCTISESWDKDDESLENILYMDGYQIVESVLQRKRKGGKTCFGYQEGQVFYQRALPKC